MVFWKRLASDRRNHDTKVSVDSDLLKHPIAEEIGRLPRRDYAVLSFRTMLRVRHLLFRSSWPN